MPSNTSLVNVDANIVCILNQKTSPFFYSDATKPLAAAELPQVAPTVAVWAGTPLPISA